MAADRLETLDAIDAAVWQQLGRATADRRHAWRTPVLATTAADGTADARTVVLREADAGRRELIVYSDARAGKVAQLGAQPLATLVHWSATLAWQLRLRVRVEVQTDGLAVTSRWARVRMSPAAQDYLSPLAPGAPLPGSAPLPRHVEQREHFAVLIVQVLAADWLELDPAGHRRAIFDERGARWVQP